MFSYKSPGSHAMINGVSAFERVHRKFDMPGSVYRVPYLNDNDKGLEMAAIAYFMLQRHASSDDEMLRMEITAYEIFKSLDVTTQVQLKNVLKSHILQGVDDVYIEGLFKDALVMLKSAYGINKEVECHALPCARVSNKNDIKYVTLSSSSNSIKEYWENVSLSLSVVTAKF